MRILTALALFAAAPALAWESTCRTYANFDAEPAQLTAPTACAPEKGPATARARWVGPGDEHRRLWEKTRELAGLPETVSATQLLTVFTGPADVTVGGRGLPSLRPAAFEQATRTQVRAVSVGELTQLPDWSYSLFDWAEGHETCPLAGSTENPEDCHDFASHMGPVNANHFLPLATSFYRRYHALAVARAQECAQVQAKLAPSGARFLVVAQACELEALALEAVAQHYLQDAWSMGHMWQRWGSPNLVDFPGATAEERREKAVVIALVSGLMHGSRSVLQKLPGWTGYDVNDALCAPNPVVQLSHGDLGVTPAVGDNYLGALSGFGGGAYDPQWQKLASCAASGMLEVYRASGELHGPAAPQGGLQSIQPGSDACFSQRATNRAMLAAAAVNMRVGSVQFNIPLDARTVSSIVPTLASSAGSVPVSDGTRHRFRFDLIRHVSLARLHSAENPDGTEVAEGGLGQFLGVSPNGTYASAAELATYVDPPLPWPAPASATQAVKDRSTALARLFHRAHAADWCAATDAAALQALKTHASNAALPQAERDAACAACVEFGVRHLRVGTGPVVYDTAREPLCHFLVPTAAFVYQMGTAGDDPVVLTRQWCGCP